MIFMIEFFRPAFYPVIYPVPETIANILFGKGSCVSSAADFREKISASGLKKTLKAV